MAKQHWFFGESQTKNDGGASRKQARKSAWEMRRKDRDVYYVRKDGSVVKVPSSGPPNTLILSGSILPHPKEDSNQ